MVTVCGMSHTDELLQVKLAKQPIYVAGLGWPLALNVHINLRWERRTIAFGLRRRTCVYFLSLLDTRPKFQKKNWLELRRVKMTNKIKSESAKNVFKKILEHPRLKMFCFLNLHTQYNLVLRRFFQQWYMLLNVQELWLYEVTNQPPFRAIVY